MDPISRRSFWDLIYALSEENVTVFVTTHYMDEAEYVNHIGFIYDGKLIAHGTPTQLKEEILIDQASPTLEEVFIALIESQNSRKASQ